MRKSLLLIPALFLILSFGFQKEVFGVCTGGVNAGNLTPNVNWQTVNVNTYRYYTFTVLHVGQTFIFSFCQGGGAHSVDTQLEIHDSFGNPTGVYNDDFCGLGSELTFVATSTGVHRISIYRYYCQSSSVAAGTMAYRTLPPPTQQDCLGALPLCNTVNTHSFTAIGTGNYYDLYNFRQPGNFGQGWPDDYNNCPNCMLDGELNSMWYTFTAQTAGWLRFTITHPASEIYDWSLHSLNGGVTCFDLVNYTSHPPLSCSWYGYVNNSTQTGMESSGTANCTHWGGHGVGNPFNAPVWVTAGQTFALHISSYIGGPGGYTISFANSTAQIVDNVPPVMQNIIYPPQCGASSLTVQFSERLWCQGVGPGDFVLTGPNGTYNIGSVWAAVCQAGSSSTATGTFYDHIWTLELTDYLSHNGSYTLTNLNNSVTDICGNPNNPASINFTITGITATVSSTHSGPCNGANTGTTTISGVAGGTPPYSYSWAGPGGFTSSSPNLSNLAAGDYYITITDVNGVCEYVNVVTVGQPPVLTYSTNVVQPSCGTLGSVEIIPNGGISPYNIQLGSSTQNGVMSYNFTNLPGGVHNIIITDAVGCQITGSVTLTIADNPNPSFTYNGNQCFVGHSFNFTHTGTVISGETYAWTFTGGTPPTSNAQNPTGITFPGPGTYNVSLQITAGPCVQSSNQNVTVYGHPTPTVNVTNENCGACDGQATTSSPFSSYSWSSGGNLQTETGLCSGNYSVVVTNTNGCTGSANFTIGGSGTIPTINNISVTNPLCFGLCTGSATVNVSGPPTFTYNYSSGTTPNNPTTGGLCAGNHTVTVSDASNPLCFTVGNFTVTQPPAMVLTMSASNATCGLANGEASVSVTNGAAPLSYAWSNGASGNPITVAAGSYTVTVTDNNGCTAQNTIIVADDGIPFSVNMTVGSNVSCNGLCDGIATANAVGLGQFTYSWSNGANTPTATGLCVGNHTVTVTEAGCIVTQNVNITQPTVLSASITAVSNAHCGQADGSLTVTANGGTPSYSYLWSTTPAQTNPVANSIPPGNYSVTVTDDNGCTTQTSGVVGDIGYVSVNVTHTNITCNGTTNGTATATVVGGSPNYTYNWSNGFNQTIPGTSSVANALGTGVITVTVTDNFGCTATGSATITEPLPINIIINNTTETSCNGFCDGTVHITVSGGTSPYNYSWSSGFNPNNNANTNLCAGNHSVQITDANTCIATTNYTIDQPDPILLDIAVTPENCGLADGSASANPIGGTPPFSYSWSHGGNPFGNVNTGLTAAGSPYHVTVTDTHGCFQTGSATVVFVSGPIASISAFENASCNGLNDGWATVSVGGGTPPYLYIWNSAPPQANPTAINLGPGNYTVTVSDQIGCSTTANIVLSQPGSLDLNILAPPVLCFGDCDGTAFANVSGGTFPYTALWSNLQSGLTATNLCSGNYHVTVTDDNGCSINGSIFLDQSPQMIVSEIITPSNCNQSDGSIEISVTGGTEPFSFAWSNGALSQNLYNIPAGTYTLTITDNKGCENIIAYNVSDITGPVATISSTTNTSCNGACNGIAQVQVMGGSGLFQFAWNTTPVQTTATATNLCAGAYSVVVTDLNTGCITTTGTTITQPSQLDVFASVEDASCYGICDATITLTPFNGTPPYTFVWSGPGVNVNSQNQANLCNGSYTVNILDNNNCFISRTYVINEPNFITVPVTTTSTGCFGGCTGTATAAPFGGTPPYYYSWLGGQSTATAIALCNGSYTVTVTDHHGCSATNTANVNTPTQMQFTDITINNVACAGSINGSVSITITGGTPPYDYVWSNGSTISNPVNLATGQHCVTVLDNNGCVIDTCIFVSTPPALVVNLSAIDQACFGSCDGSISASVSGGVAPYSYLWSNSEVVSTINNLCTGIYNVTVTDHNNCQSYASTSISSPSVLGIVVQNIINPTCGNNDGAISIGVTGGSSPFTYQWSTGTSTSNTLSNIPAGNYTITVTDSHSCSVMQTISLTDISAPIITDIIVNNVDCFGNLTGSAEVIFTSTTPSNTINWSDGQFTALAVNLVPGPYSVTVTDENNCSAAGSIVITEPSVLTSSIATFNNVTCNGFCNGNATVLASGGTQPYSYSWSSGAGTSLANNLCPGMHTVTVTDANSCVSTAEIIITQPDPLVLTGTPVHATCYGGNNGMITVNTTGGSGNYIYSWPQIGSNSNVVTGLTASAYTVVVYDQLDNSCFASQTFVVGQPAEIQAFFTTENSTCGFDNGEVSVDVIYGGTGAYTYEWNPGGHTGSHVQDLAPGTYVVTITDGNGCTVSYNVVVNATAPMSINNVIYQGVTCHGYNDGFAQIFVSGGTQPYIYNWNPNVTDQASSNELFAGVYNVEVIDQDNCTAYTSFPIGTPDPVIVYPNDGATICIGQSAIVTASASGGNGPYTYYWDGLGFGSTFIVNPEVSTNYFVIAYDSRGCESEPEIVEIDVHLPLSLIVSTPSAICQGQVSTLTALASGGDGNYRYDWGDGIITTSNTFHVSPNATTTFTIIVSDGCTTPPDTAIVTTSVAPMPEMHIVRNPYTGCSPLTVTFDNNTNNLNYSYYWDFDDPTSSSPWSDLKRPLHTFIETGVYNVKVVVSTNLGCKDSTTVLVRVHEGPTADFIANPWSTGLFEPEINFNDASTGAVAWEWDFGDGSGSSETNPTHVYFNQGEFPVTLTVYSQYACKDTVTKQITIIDDLRIYFPTAINLRSPGNNEFYPKGVGIDVENYQMTIYNRWGEIIYTTRDYNGRWQGRYNNNKGDFVPQGVYTYVVTLRDKYGKDYTFSGYFTVFK